MSYRIDIEFEKPPIGCEVGAVGTSGRVHGSDAMRMLRFSTEQTEA